MTKSKLSPMSLSTALNMELIVQLISIIRRRSQRCPHLAYCMECPCRSLRIQFDYRSTCAAQPYRIFQKANLQQIWKSLQTGSHNYFFVSLVSLEAFR